MMKNFLLLALTNSVADALDNSFDITNLIHNIFNALADFLMFASSDGSRNTASGISESRSKLGQVSDALGVGAAVGAGLNGLGNEGSSISQVFSDGGDDGDAVGGVVGLGAVGDGLEDFDDGSGDLLAGVSDVVNAGFGAAEGGKLEGASELGRALLLDGHGIGREGRSHDDENGDDGEERDEEGLGHCFFEFEFGVWRLFFT